MKKACKIHIHVLKVKNCFGGTKIYINSHKENYIVYIYIL